MVTKRAYFAICASTALLAACGGGGGMTPGAHALPGNGVASFVVTVPPQVNAGSARAPKFISPGTQSITISVNSSGVPTMANLTPSSPNCVTGSPAPSLRKVGVASGGTLTCTIDVIAPIGNDTFVVKLWSGTNGTGTMLGASTVQQAVSERTPVNIVMDGVPAAVTIVLGNPSPLVGASVSITVNVTVQDPSGAVIVGPGNYTTPVTLTDSDTSGHTHLSTTSVSGPGAAVTLTYDGSSSVSSATISASTNGTNVTTVTPATLRPANAQNGGGGVGVVTIGGNVYAEVPSASGLIQVPLTHDGILKTTPPSPNPSASGSPAPTPTPDSTLLAVQGGVDACAVAPVSGNIDMLCVNVDAYPTSVNVIGLSSGTPILNSSFTTDAVSQLGYSGGSCYICGLTWDPRDNAVLMSVGDDRAGSGDHPGRFEFYSTSGTKARADIPMNDITENFGYNSATDQIFNAGYNEVDLVDIPSSTVYKSSDQLFSYPDIDSSAVDPVMNIGVGIDEFGGNGYFAPLNTAVLASPAPSAAPALGSFTTPNLGEAPIAKTMIADGNNCLPDAITIDGTSHIAFLSGEYSEPNCVSAVVLPAGAQTGALPATYMGILNMPNTPDGRVFQSALDPHVAATFYLSGADVYGLVYDYCRAWVSVVDITKLLASPAWANDPHIVDPAYDLLGNGVITYIPTGYDVGPASNGDSYDYPCPAPTSYSYAVKPGTRMHRRHPRATRR